jgi:hypothetical protein
MVPRINNNYFNIQKWPVDVHNGEAAFPVSWELELYILSHVCVTIDGVWIGNWIY